MTAPCPADNKNGIRQKVNYVHKLATGAILYLMRAKARLYFFVNDADDVSASIPQLFQADFEALYRL